MARVGAHTVTGKRGHANQDSCCLKVAMTPVGEIGMAIVCDGVGGLGNGEVASGSVIRRFAQWFDSELPNYVKLNARSRVLDLTGIKQEWATLLNRCNHSLYEQGARSGNQMGCTFTGILACGGVYILAQVGDSRCYLIDGEEALALSSDQTVVAREVSRGSLSFEEAEHHPQRKAILQAVGAQNGVIPDFRMGSYGFGNMFLICSDGLYEQLSNDELWQLFAPVLAAEDGVITEACENAVNLAVSRGEADDITAICLAMEAWSARQVYKVASASESETMLFQDADRLQFLEDGNDPTLLMEQPEERQDTFAGTRSGTEASTAGGMQGFPFEDDDDESTVDSFELGEA